MPPAHFAARPKSAIYVPRRLEAWSHNWTSPPTRVDHPSWHPIGCPIATSRLSQTTRPTPSKASTGKALQRTVLRRLHRHLVRLHDLREEHAAPHDEDRQGEHESAGNIPWERIGGHHYRALAATDRGGVAVERPEARSEGRTEAHALKRALEARTRRRDGATGSDLLRTPFS